jgi:hypothetical protein
MPPINRPDDPCGLQRDWPALDAGLLNDPREEPVP